MNIAVPWESGTWTTPPVEAVEDNGSLLVTAAEDSDAWRSTAYGFVHQNEHGLLAPWKSGNAVEVSLVAAFDRDFDQAGILIRAGAEEWIKTGIEFADGELQLGAVVTHGKSDWSTSPVPEWAGSEVTIRASRFEDAVVVRARVGHEPWRLVRLAPFDPEMELAAGPYCAAPTRTGLTVKFTSWTLTAPDEAIH